MRGKYEKSVDVPKYILAVIDEIAAVENVPTKRLLAEWLWEKAKKQSGNSRFPLDLTKRLRSLPEPYDDARSTVRSYPRQERKDRIQ